MRLRKLLLFSYANPPPTNALAFIGVLMAVGLTVTNIFFFLKIGAYELWSPGGTAGSKLNLKSIYDRFLKSYQIVFLTVELIVSVLFMKVNNYIKNTIC